MASRRSTPLPGTVAARLRDVARDRRSGARALELRTLAALGPLVNSPRGPGRGRARAVADALSRLQPAMGAFRQWSADWRRLALGPESDSRRSARRWLRRRRREVRSEPLGLVRAARRISLTGARVVTISRSDSVLRLLRALPPSRRPRRVDALESRPGGEGRDFARDLRRAGVVARTIPDRAGSAAVRRSDGLVIGADAVLPDGSVVHKVGTRRLATVAVRAGVPVWVVAGRSKWIERPAGRIGRSARFDRTPARTVSAYWTDRGVVRGPRGPLGTRAPRLRGRRALPPVRRSDAVRRWRR